MHEHLNDSGIRGKRQFGLPILVALICGFIIGGFVFWNYMPKTPPTLPVELATVKKGEIVYSFPILHKKRQIEFVPKGTVINQVTGEESSCILDIKARLEVMGSSENHALLIVRENSTNSVHQCDVAEEILVSVDDVVDWKIAEAKERNQGAVIAQKRATNLAILRDIKAGATPR